MIWGKTLSTISSVLTIAAVATLGFVAGRDTAPKAPVVTAVDTVPPESLLQALEDARLETEGLRARLEGRVPLTPVTILRTDTVMVPPDTIVQFFKITDGRMVLAPMTRVSGELFAPELQTFDLGNCDDGLAFQGGEVVCDPARLGHLWLGLGVDATTEGVYPALSASWRPSYRSPWSVWITTTGVRHSLFVSRGIQLF